MVKIYPIISRKIGAGLNNMTSDLAKILDFPEVPVQTLEIPNPPALPKIIFDLPDDSFERFNTDNLPKFDVNEYNYEEKYNLIGEWGDILFILLGFL